jgi:integrase/recombinase XerD
MTSSLASEIRKLKESTSISFENKELITRFVEYMQTQTDISEKYKRNNLLTIRLFAEHLGKEKDIPTIRSKHEVTSFLDTRIKDETIDPDKKWFGTWNDYLNRIRHFMRWLHNDIAESDWQTPSFVQIKSKKSKRLSPYAESELWERKDILTVVKYETSKRNKAVLTLLWDFNARPHEVTRLKIKHIRLRESYGEAEIPHDSKTGSGPAMLTCSFPYVRDWLNEHPFRNEPEAKLICSIRKGGPMTPDALWTIMRQLRKRIVGLLESGSISEVKEKENLERIINTKNWAPYCLRHSSITCDAETYPEFALRKKVRWSPNSVQPARYIKNR